MRPKISILIPTYNASSTVRDTLKSIIFQNFTNFEVIVQDNNSQDNTIQVVRDCKDKRIRIFKNNRNLGAPNNLMRAKSNAKGEIIFLMASDDLLAQGALLSTYNAFESSSEIGAVTRPYFWFDKDPQIAVRAKKQLNSRKDEIVHIGDSFDRLRTVLSTLDQLSGLAYRAKFMKETFSEDLWTTHVFPFLWIFRTKPVIFLKDYTVAVRIGSSATRKNIYMKSPMQCWIKLFNDVFYTEQWRQTRERFIKDFVSINYVGLIQIASYGTLFSLFREIWYLIRYRPTNLLSPMFWFMSVGVVFVPPKILIVLVDTYKNVFNSILLSKINFEPASISEVR